MNPDIYRIMLSSFDTILNKRQEELLRVGLETNPELARDQEFFSNLRAVLFAPSQFTFGKSFVHQVVSAAYSTYNEFNHWLEVSFRRVAVAAVLLAALCAYSNLSERDTVDIASLFGQPQPTMYDVVRLERYLQ